MLEPAGTINRPAVRATLAARDMRAADWPAGTVDADTSADREGMRVHRLDARADPGAAQRVRRLHLERPGQRPVRRVRQRHRRAGGRFQATPLAMSGSAHLEGHVAGNGRPAARAGDADRGRRGNRGDVHRPRRRQYRTRRHSGLRLMRTRRRSPRGREWTWTSPAPMTTTPKPVRRTSIPAAIPASLRNQFAIGEGVITGSVRARGMLSHPLEVAAKADLDELELTLSGTRIRLQRSATLDVSPDRITAEHVDLAVGQTTRVQVSGTLAIHGCGGAGSSSRQWSARRSRRDCRPVASTRDACQR